VEDLELVLSIIAGGRDAGPQLTPLKAAPTLAPSELTIWLPEEPLASASDAAAKATLSAVDVLRQQGATVESISLPALKRSFWIWLAMMGTAGFETYAEVLGDGKPISVTTELLKRSIGRSDHTVPPLLIALFEQINDLAPILSLDKLVAEGHALREDLEQRLGDRGVLMLPTMPRGSPLHHGFMLRPWDTGGCGIFNVTALPATTVPSGRTSAGLPLGVQVVGAHGRDFLTLRVAKWIEEGLGGWVRAEPR